MTLTRSNCAGKARMVCKVRGCRSSEKLISVKTLVLFHEFGTDGVRVVATVVITSLAGEFRLTARDSTGNSCHTLRRKGTRASRRCWPAVILTAVNPLRAGRQQPCIVSARCRVRRHRPRQPPQAGCDPGSFHQRPPSPGRAERCGPPRSL